MSAAPPPVSVICERFCHTNEPPVEPGAVGGVRSRRMVLPGVGVAGAHRETLPAASTARNWTTDSPSALTTAVEPLAAAVQITPPSAEVRYW